VLVACRDRGADPIAQVAGIDGLVEGLRGKGVTFVEYASGALQTTNGIARIGGMRAAWFSDTEGNILGLRDTST
jgi:hypothetical protein